MKQAPPDNPHELARQAEDAAKPLHPYDERMRAIEAARRANQQSAPVRSPVVAPDSLKTNTLARASGDKL